MSSLDVQFSFSRTHIFNHIWKLYLRTYVVTWHRGDLVLNQEKKISHYGATKENIEQRTWGASSSTLTMEQHPGPWSHLWGSTDLAGIFGIHFCQISELPRLLPFVEIPLVRLLHFYHFHLDRPLCGNFDGEAAREFHTHKHCLIDPNRCLRRLHACLPVAQRKQFFFFLPALQTLTMHRRRSSLGVKMSLWSACLMAVMVDAVGSTSGIQQGSTGKKNPDFRGAFFVYLHWELMSFFHICL